MQISRNSLDTAKGPAEWFTGDVYIDTIAAPAGTSTFAAAQCPLHPRHARSVRVREATREDAAAVAQFLDELGFPADPGTVTRRLAGLGPNDVVLIADGGLVALHQIPLLAEGGALARITALVVSSAQRRAGLATDLLAATEGVARRWGCDRIEVSSAGGPTATPPMPSTEPRGSRKRRLAQCGIGRISVDRHQPLRPQCVGACEEEVIASSSCRTSRLREGHFRRACSPASNSRTRSPARSCSTAGAASRAGCSATRSPGARGGRRAVPARAWSARARCGGRW
jgi:GNAT superfamily N-acetyltransferase